MDSYIVEILRGIQKLCQECEGDHDVKDCPHVQIVMGEELAQQIVDRWV